MHKLVYILKLNILVCKGKVLFELGEYEKALDEYDATISKNPTGNDFNLTNYYILFICF